MDAQNMMYIYTIEYYLAISEILIHAITWKNLENILSETSQTQKYKYYDSTYKKYLEKANS